MLYIIQYYNKIQFSLSNFDIFWKFIFWKKFSRMPDFCLFCHFLAKFCNHFGLLYLMASLVHYHFFPNRCIFLRSIFCYKLMREQAWAGSQIFEKNKIFHYFCHFRSTYNPYGKTDQKSEIPIFSLYILESFIGFFETFFFGPFQDLARRVIP